MKKIYNKNNLFLLTFIIVFFSNGFSQNSPLFFNPGSSAVLELNSSDKGFLTPRMNTFQINSISVPAVGLWVYNTDDNCFWVKQPIGWKKMCNTDDINQSISILDSRIIQTEIAVQNQWSILGNSNINPTLHFIGTINNSDLIFKTNNFEQVRILADGKVGINTDNPTTNLDINGSLRVRQGASNNYVFTSSTDGTGSWKELNFNLNAGYLSLLNHNAGIDLSNLYSTGTGINITNRTIINTAPDQTVTLTGGSGIIATGTYPNFTIYNDAPDLSVNLANGQGISVNGTYPNFTISNTQPDQPISITGFGSTTVTGTYPVFYVNSFDNDNQTLLINNNDLTISNGNTISLPTNSAGTGINISNGIITNTGDLDNTNELQNLSLSNNTLSISNGNSVNLSSYLDNTDNQTLSINNSDLTISNGNTISLPTNTAGTGINITNGIITNTGDLDNTNELQNLSLSNNTLSISNGNNVNLSSYLDNTDNQTLSISNNDLTISNGNTLTLPTNTAGTGINITSGIITNTAPDQTITLTGLGATSVSGTYPNFTINSTDNNTTYSAGTGLTLSGTIFNAQNTTALWNANKLQGKNISTITPTAGQVLKYIQGTWKPAADNIGTYTAGSGISINEGEIFNTAPDKIVSIASGTGINVTGTYPNFSVAAQNTTALWNANKLQGKDISTLAPHTGQVLKWVGSKWTPSADLNTSLQAGVGISISEGEINNTGDLSNTNELQSLSYNTINNILTISGITGIGSNVPIPNFWSKIGNDLYNNNSGKVGIGITNPNELLDVNGNIRINNNALYLRGAGDNYHAIKYTNSFEGQAMDGPVIFGYSGGALGSKTDWNGEKLALSWNSSGNVSLGTTAEIEGAKLTIKQGHGNWLTLGRTANNGIWMFHNPPGQDRLLLSLKDNNGNYNWDYFSILDNGYVGIGTAQPTEKLEVNGAIKIGNTTLNIDGSIKYLNGNFLGCSNGQWYPMINYWDKNGNDIYRQIGNIGIGTSSPNSKLHVKDSYLTIDGNSDVTINSWFQRIKSPVNSAWFVYDGTGASMGQGMTTNGWYWLLRKSNGSYWYPMYFTFDGSQNMSLTVCGNIRTTKVILDYTWWSDFVFRDSYKLKPLSEVEKFIKENKHLPDIPAEKEIIENGLDVGNINAKFLQKIEELTLYVIEQQKQIESIKKELEQYKK